MTHNSSHVRRSVLSLALLGASAAFSASADSPLNIDMPKEWGEQTPASAVVAGSLQWWQAFGDPMLDSLITLGQANNYDVAMAVKRINIARAAVRQAKSGWYPSIGLSADWTRARSSGRTAGSQGDASTASYFDVGANLSWEIDIFGRVNSKVRQAKAAVKVSSAEFSATMLSLDAEIARTYIGLLVDLAQLKVAQEHTESQKHIVEITETRHRTGLASKLDVAQARTLYYSTVAQIPLLEASIEASYNSLAVLLGTTREGLPASLFEDHTLPSHFQLAGLGTPLEMLRRRPDIVESERNIELAAAQLGVAQSDYMPSLTIQATAGTQAHSVGDLFTGPSFTYSVAPTLSWTLFDGFARRAATVSAKEAMQVQVDNYNMTVLTAIEEVRNALARYHATLKYIDTTKLVVENSEESVRLSLDQYKHGLSDFYNLVEAQLNNLTYQNSLVSAKGQALTALVELYKALGGNFQN